MTKKMKNEMQIKEELTKMAKHFDKEIIKLFNKVSNKGQCADAFADFHGDMLDKFDKMIEYYEERTNKN